jgi:hypothetical protein
MVTGAGGRLSERRMLMWSQIWTRWLVTAGASVVASCMLSDSVEAKRRILENDGREYCGDAE